MPRKDGLPTNEELLTRLNSYGVDLFLSAYERTYGDGIIPRSFLEKKIGNLALTIIQYHKPDENLPGNPLISETLSIMVADYDDATDMFEHHLRYKGDQDRADKMRMAALFIGQKAVGESLSFESKPYPEAFDTEWTAYLKDTERTRHVSTLKAKPNKQSLVSAIDMAEMSIKYVESDEYPQNPINRFQRGVLMNEGDFYYFRHKWSIKFSYDLNFTGYENLDYLEVTKKALLEEIVRYKSTILSLPSESNPRSDLVKQGLATREACLERVNKAIANNLLMNM